MSCGRILALDVGDVRIGIAVSDANRVIAMPVGVYRRVGFAPDCKHILTLCEQYATRNVLLGLPLHMSGALGAQALNVRVFGDILTEAGLHVIYTDERMTTITAQRALLQGNVSRKKRKENVDKLAATVILEQWLACGARTNDNPS